jgi:hypothetical protein
LIARVNGDDRRRVFEKITSLVDLPADVTREGILNLDPEMLKKWKEKLEFYWISSSGLDPKLAADSWKSGAKVPATSPKLKGQ